MKIFDSRPEDDRDIPSLVAFDPHVIGVTVPADCFVRAQHGAWVINEKLPCAVFIVGGVHVTALPWESMEEYRARYKPVT